MSNELKACPFCGSNDVRLDYKVTVCDCCGSEAFHEFWNRRVVTREHVETMAREYCHEREWSENEQLDIAVMHVNKMLRAAGFEVAE